MGRATPPERGAALIRPAIGWNPPSSSGAVGQINMPGAVEAVLEANRHLAAQGALLPAGLTIILPDLKPPTARPLVRLWGRE